MFNLLLAFVVAGSTVTPPWQYGGYYANHKACVNAAKALFPENVTGYYVCVSVKDGSTPTLEN